MPVITPMPIATIFTNFDTVATKIFEALGSMIGTITNTPLLLLVLLLGLVPFVLKIAMSIYHRLRG